MGLIYDNNNQHRNGQETVPKEQVKQRADDLNMLKQLFAQHDGEYLEDILAQSNFDFDQAMETIVSMD